MSFKLLKTFSIDKTSDNVDFVVYLVITGNTCKLDKAISGWVFV